MFSNDNITMIFIISWRSCLECAALVGVSPSRADQVVHAASSGIPSRCKKGSGMLG